MSTGSYDNSWQNFTQAQNFADHINLSTETTVLRYRHYTSFDPSFFGNMDVKLLDGTSSSPGSVLDTQNLAITAYGVDGVYSGITVYYVDINLNTTWNLAANTDYWVGASGDGFEAAQISLKPGPFDSTIALFNGATFSRNEAIGDQAFQLYDTAAVPEPATLTLLALGALTALRKRKK